MTTPKMIIRTFGEKTVLSCAVTSDGETAVIGGPDGVGRTVHLGIPAKRKGEGNTTGAKSSTLSILAGRSTTSITGNTTNDASAPADDDGCKGVEWGPNLRREPHVGDINALQMFPSDKVVLSCGGDFVLGVWDLASGRRAATLRGHQRGVLTAGIIDRGRNVVSGSSDGTVKLWEIASQTVIRDLYASTEDPTTMRLAVNCVCVADGYTHAAPGPVPDPREVGTGDRLVLAALESGAFCGLDPRAPKATAFEVVAGTAGGVPATACCACGSSLYACGYEDGRVRVFDPRRPEEAMGEGAEMGVSRAAVSGMRCAGEGRFWVATKDGHLWLQRGAGEREIMVNTHGCEPITCIDTYDGGRGVVAGLKDGGVLVYDFGN